MSSKIALNYFLLKNRDLVSDLDTSNPQRKVVESAYKVIWQTFMQSHKNFCYSTKFVVEKQNKLARFQLDLMYSDLIQPIVMKAYKNLVHSISLSVEVTGRTITIIFGRSSIAA